MTLAEIRPGIDRSFKETVFLGAEAGNEEWRRNVLDYGQKINDTILRPGDGASKTVQNKRAEELTGQLSAGKYKTEAEIKSDLSKTMGRDEKDKLVRLHQFLSQSIFAAMLLGEARPGFPDYAAILGRGGRMEIENSLPDAFKGIGGRLRSFLISNKNILRVIDELDQFRAKRKWQLLPPSNEVLKNKLQETADRLIELDIDERNPDWEQYKMVMAYIGSQIQDLEEKKEVREVRGLRKDVNALWTTEKEHETSESKGKEEAREKRNTKQRREFFYSMWANLSQETVTPGSPLMPEWMEPFNRTWLKKVVDLNNANFFKVNTGDLKQLIAYGGQAAFTATNEEMDILLYSPDSRGVRETMSFLLQAFFRLEQENGVDVLRLRGNEETVPGSGRKVADYYNNKDLILHDLIDKFAKGPGAIFNSGDPMADQADVNTAAAIAKDLLNVAYTWESAGVGAMTSFSSFQMTVFMYPDKRANTKNRNLEPWGGQLGDWAIDVRKQAQRGNGSCDAFCRKWDQSNERFVPKYEQKGEVHLFPQRLYTSFFESEDMEAINLTTGEKQKSSMIRALYNGHKIDFSQDGSTNLWNKNYLNRASGALTLNDVATGKKPIGLKPMERTAWVTEVVAAIQNLSGNGLVKPYLDEEMISGLIAASIPTGYDRVTKPVFLPKMQDRDLFLESILRPMIGTVIDKATARRVKNRFMGNLFNQAANIL